MAKRRIVDNPTPPQDKSATATQENIPVTKAPPQPHWNVNGAQLGAEYVSGGGYVYLANYIRSLPQYIDDVTRDFGDDLYERMLLDYQINSCIRLLKIAVLKDGVELDPAVSASETSWGLGSEDILNPSRTTPPKDEDIKLAKEICDWWEVCLESLERPFMDVLFEMMDFIALGNRIGEMVWELRDSDDGEPRICLKNIKTKPRKSYAFVVDAFTNTLGVLAMIPGQGYPVITGTIVGDPSKLPNMLPMEKFFRLTWGAKNNDPRGISLLRCVYNPWWLKQQTYGEFIKYLAQFAGPSILGFTSPEAQPVVQTDSNGNPIPGAAVISPEQAMLNTLLNFKNGSAAVFHNGSDVRPFPVQAEGNQVFMSAIQAFDQQIAKGILCQILATEIHQHQARAAAGTQQDVLDDVILQAKQHLGNAIRQQILYQGVKYNWGEKIAKKLTPKVRLQQSEGHNWAQDAGAIASLVSSKFLSPSQFAALDAKLGLPARTEAPQALAEQMGMGGQPQPGAMPGQSPQSPGQPGMPQPSLPQPIQSAPTSTQQGQSDLHRFADPLTRMKGQDATFSFVPPPGSQSFAGSPPAGWVLVATGPEGGNYYAPPQKQPAQQPQQKQRVTKAGVEVDAVRKGDAAKAKEIWQSVQAEIKADPSYMTAKQAGELLKSVKNGTQQQKAEALMQLFQTDLAAQRIALTAAAKASSTGTIHDPSGVTNLVWDKIKADAFRSAATNKLAGDIRSSLSQTNQNKLYGLWESNVFDSMSQVPGGTDRLFSGLRQSDFGGFPNPYINAPATKETYMKMRADPRIFGNIFGGKGVFGSSDPNPSFEENSKPQEPRLVGY